MVQSRIMVAVREGPKLVVKFFRQKASNSEPVRDWLKELPLAEKKAIGQDIKAVQFGWPLGLPLIDHLGGEIWEVRTRLENRIARVLFVVDGNIMILLHGFIKKEQKTSTQDLALARERLKRMRGTK
ncbi:MAG: type II toxin-antitoxin system RelE/ParE family toxin [Zoogloeaceae bacterium]|nr:type II toxin-antitoxin system RelE/ParE family toxin [Zoogloeaceae bacterium]